MWVLFDVIMGAVEMQLMWQTLVFVRSFLLNSMAFMSWLLVNA